MTIALPRLRQKPSIITLADRARDAGDWEAAARLYRKALARNPRNPPIWVQYGHALKESGRLAEAEAAYRRALAYDPRDADAHLQLGHALKLQGRKEEAQSAYLRSYLFDSSHNARATFQELGGIFQDPSIVAELVYEIPEPGRRVSNAGKPTVLIVNSFYPPQAVGGATRVVTDNIAHFATTYRNDFKIEVFTAIVADDNDYKVSSYIQDGVKVTAVARPNSPEIELHVIDKEIERIFINFLQSLQPAIVHFHCIQRLSASVVAAARRLGIPYLITAHDGWWISDAQFIVNDDDEISLYDYSRMRKDPHSRMAHLQPLLFDAQNVLAVSEKFAELYRQCGVPNVLSVPNGVSCLPHVVRTPALDGRVRLGFASGRDRHKGYHLIEVALRSREYRHLHLTIVDGSLAAGETKREIWGATEVLLLPKFSEDHIVEFYAMIDVLLAPSVCIESFGLVTREALQCGCWVIASNRGSIGECVREGINGFVIGVSSPEDLINVLASIDADPQRYLSSPPAPPIFRTAAEQADDLVNLYKSLISTPQAGLSPNGRTEWHTGTRCGSVAWSWVKGGGTAQQRAVARGRLGPQTRVIAACVPRHSGVAASTLSLFENVILFPKDPTAPPESVQPREIEEFAEELSLRRPDHFIVSGGDRFMIEVVSRLQELAPTIKIHLLWHSNFLQMGEEYDVALLREWIALCRANRVKGILTVKKGFDNYLSNFGVVSRHIPYVVSRDLLQKRPRPKDNNRKSLGVWLSGSSAYRKRPQSVLFAAKLLQKRGFHLQAAGIGSEGVGLVHALGLDFDFLSAAPLPRDQLMRRMSETDVTAYITVSECSPMLPLESWSVGVPAVIGPSCRYFEEDDVLRSALVVKNAASPEEIADRVAYVAEHKEQILGYLDQYYEAKTAEAGENLGDYLTLFERHP